MNGMERNMPTKRVNVDVYNDTVYNPQSKETQWKLHELNEWQDDFLPVQHHRKGHDPVGYRKLETLQGKRL